MLNKFSLLFFLVRTRKQRWKWVRSLKKRKRKSPNHWLLSDTAFKLLSWYKFGVISWTYSKTSHLFLPLNPIGWDGGTWLGRLMGFFFPHSLTNSRSFDSHYFNFDRTQSPCSRGRIPSSSLSSVVTHQYIIIAAISEDVCSLTVDI